MPSPDALAACWISSSPSSNTPDCRRGKDFDDYDDMVDDYHDDHGDLCL